jgi:hypothetical protein
MKSCWRAYLEYEGFRREVFLAGDCGRGVLKLNLCYEDTGESKKERE